MDIFQFMALSMAWSQGACNILLVNSNQSLYFQYFDKIALLDPNTGWFDMFLVLLCAIEGICDTGHNPAHIKFRDIFHI